MTYFKKKKYSVYYLYNFQNQIFKLKICQLYIFIYIMFGQLKFKIYIINS